MIDYFPLDIAYDAAFFDREVERKRLKYNIETNTHTLVTSPRRYGKTSLVFRSIAELAVIGIQIDLMVATDSEKIQMIILDGIGNATAAITAGKVKLVDRARKIFQPFGMVESVELGKMSFKFYPAPLQKAPHLIVLEALQRLEKLAGDTGNKVVLFLDEYQHALDIKGIGDFEAALRSFAQTAKHVVFVFSGSNRHILQEMFSDKSRPFYNMCDHILLNKISQKDYERHLMKLAKKQWKKQMDDEVLATILAVTTRHSYYINLLCRRLWQREGCLSVADVLNEWQTIAAEKKYEVSGDFDKITPIQRSILVELAREPFARLASKAVMARLNASVTGVTHAMADLVRRDYVFRDEQNVYRVLNPLMEYVLQQQARSLN
jgi:uncharacterized protein